MRYRINELENAEREKHSIAKAILEGMTGNEHIHLPDAEPALQTMGFRREQPVTLRYLGPVQSYSRETADGIELLVDRDITKAVEKTPHLYRIPEGQELQDWYGQVPRGVEPKKWTFIALPVLISGASLFTMGYGVISGKGIV